MNRYDVPKRIIDTLESGGVSYRVWCHSELGARVDTPLDFAKATGCSLQQVTKSLLVRERGGRRSYAIAVCAVTSKINLPALSALLKLQDLELASHLEIGSVLGQPRKGVSPIGVTECVVAMENACFSEPTIFVGAGRVGYEIEISPQGLQDVTHAICGNFKV